MSEEHFARTFEAVDRALLAAMAVQNNADERGLAVAHEALRDLKNLSAVIQSLSWTNANGDIVASSAFLRPPPLNAARLEHIRVHAERGDSGLFIGRPFVTQLSDAWVAPMTRRLSRPDGSFDGVASALVDLSYFRRLYNSMTIGETQTIALLRRDGTFVMREPQMALVQGQSIADVPLFSPDTCHPPTKARSPPAAASMTWIASSATPPFPAIRWLSPSASPGTKHLPAGGRIDGITTR